ncbi:MAG: hypothetical protein JWR59_209 [Brevundimonas sp.]|nr:hypothetical protein [Brevundimonas sp.]
MARATRVVAGAQGPSRAGVGALVATIGVLAVAGAPAVAWAQSSVPLTPSLNSVANQKLAVTLNAAATYETNVGGASDAGVAIKGLHKGDFTYNPSASVTGGVPLGIGTLILSGNIGYLFHQYNSELNAPQSSIQANFAGPLRFGPCGANAILGFSAAPSDQSQLVLQTLKNIQTQTTLGASVQCVTGKVLEQVSATHSTSNSSSDVGTRNSSSNAMSVGVGYASQMIGKFLLTGSYSTSDYDAPAATAASPVTSPLLVTGFESYSVGVQLTRAITNRLNGDASLSYGTSQSRGGIETQKSTTFTGSGSLVYRLNSRIGATLAYDRQQAPSIQIGSGFSTQDTLALGVTYNPSSRLSGGLGYRLFRRQEHVDPILAALLASATREDGYALTATAGLKVGRQGSLSLNLAKSTRNTNLTIYNYTDYSVGIVLSERF